MLRGGIFLTLSLQTKSNVFGFKNATVNSVNCNNVSKIFW